MTTPSPPPVASPCINVCRMHAETGWCEGCLRTLAEIAAWGQLADAERLAVLRGLPARRLHWRALRTARLAAAAVSAAAAASPLPSGSGQSPLAGALPAADTAGLPPRPARPVP